MEEKNSNSAAKLAEFANKCPNLELVMAYGYLLNQVEKINSAIHDVAKLDFEVMVSLF